MFWNNAVLSHPQCKNLMRFSLFQEVLLLYAIVSVLLPLFYVTCELHRFLH